MDTVVSHGTDQLTVFGLIDTADESGRPTQRRLGVSRETNGEFRFKVDGVTAATTSALADVLPLVIINSDSFALLEGSPQGRRRYLDWGVFHTLPLSRESWRQYQRAHQQRNALLRQPRVDGRQLALWDQHLATAGEELTRYRRRHLDELQSVIERTLEQLAPEIGDLKIVFHGGWDAQQPLVDALGAHREKDIMHGGTQVGPHRADLRIRLGRRPASEALSRGQTKMLVAAMLMAQGIFYREQRGGTCVTLVDDLPAELDAQHRRAVVELVSGVGQAFVTGTDAEHLLAACGDGHGDRPPKLFHVEQGWIKALDSSQP